MWPHRTSSVPQVWFNLLQQTAAFEPVPGPVSPTAPCLPPSEVGSQRWWKDEDGLISAVRAAQIWGEATNASSACNPNVHLGQLSTVLAGHRWSLGQEPPSGAAFGPGGRRRVQQQMISRLLRPACSPGGYLQAKQSLETAAACSDRREHRGRSS